MRRPRRIMLGKMVSKLRRKIRTRKDNANDEQLKCMSRNCPYEAVIVINSWDGELITPPLWLCEKHWRQKSELKAE